MFQRILVLFEEEKVSEVALASARELALRMDAEVALLMLIAMAFGDRRQLSSRRQTVRQIEERVGKRLTELADSFLSRGITVGAALRLGDPIQELLKFLSQRRPFQTVIWGSHSSADGLPPPRHWLARVAKSLECPVLVAAEKGNWKNL